MAQSPALDSDLADSRQWAIKKVAGVLMIAAATLVVVVTLLLDLRGHPYAPITRKINYGLSPIVAASGLYLLRTRRRLPIWLANSIPSIAAALICLPTSTNQPVDELSPLLLMWPVAFAASVLSERVAWTTAGVSAFLFGALVEFGRGVDGLVLWFETSSALAVVCWMAVRVQNESLRLRAALSNLARTDPLTGLLNRRGFDEALAREYARHLRGGQPMALLLVDIDHFKRVNDVWGHQAGDETLRQLGTLLLNAFRAADVVGRIGGEEFATMLVECGPAEAAERAQVLCDQVRTRSREWDHPVTVSVGIAVALENSPNTSPSALMAAADAALYAAKSAGRDRIRIDPDSRPGENGRGSQAP